MTKVEASAKITELEETIKLLQDNIAKQHEREIELLARLEAAESTVFTQVISQPPTQPVQLSPTRIVSEETQQDLAVVAGTTARLGMQALSATVKAIAWLGK